MTYQILIVEDSTLVALDLARTLEDAGLVVVGTAKNAESALRLAEEQHIDLATMDIELAGGGCGAVTAQKLWEDHAVPSLIISGSITDQVREFLAPAKPIGFISKPFDPDDVLCAVTTFLQQERSHTP
ncbi:response regulator [Paracoccus yeei]|uniref:response regulator n=1 Tax=Paracoccus yeei TaxID=147645 RepID=UPI003BF7AA15